MQKVQDRHVFARQQISSDLLWGMTKNYTSYLVKNNGTTFSRDPLNLSGLNTMRDSGVSAGAAIGISYDSNNIRRFKEKKVKKKGAVVRFTLRVKSKRLIPRKHLNSKAGDKVALLANITKRKMILPPVHNRSVFVEHRQLSARSCAKVIKRGLTNYRKDLVPLAMRRLKRLHRFKIANKWKTRAEAKKQK